MKYGKSLKEEAMSLKCPVVVSDVGGLQKIVGNDISGLVVPASNIFSLASAIDRLMIDKELRSRFGLNARKRIQQNFSVDILVKKSVVINGNLLTH